MALNGGDGGGGSTMDTNSRAGSKRCASDEIDRATGGGGGGGAPDGNATGGHQSRCLAATAAGEANAPPSPPLVEGSPPAHPPAPDGDARPGVLSDAAAATDAVAARTAAAPAAAPAVWSPPPADASVAAAAAAAPAFLLSMPDDLLRAVASRLTLLDRWRLAATCRPLYALLYEGVALGVANAFLGPTPGDVPVMKPWHGACVPLILPLAAGGHPDTVEVVGVTLSRADAAAQGRAALRAVAMAADVAVPRQSLTAVDAHILECHPDGGYAVCSIVNRAAMSRSAARTLWGIPASYEWVEQYYGLQRRSDHSRYIVHPLRQVLREAFRSRTPTDGSGGAVGGGGGGSGGGPIGLARIVADMETRRVAAPGRDEVPAKAATAPAAVVDRIDGERVARGGGAGGGGSGGGGV